MKLRKSYNGKWYVVFASQEEADKWDWLFSICLRRIRSCFGQYDNAFELF